MIENSTIDNDDIEVVNSETEDLSFDTANYEIISYGADYTVSVLFDKMRKNEIVIPNFQRNYVWNIKQASKLIESFLLGLPVPGIFLSKEIDSGELLVVDGQQRLKTIQAFINGLFPITNEVFHLTNVKEKWEGLTFDKLEIVDKRRFEDSILRATIIQQVNPRDNTSVYHIFERLNTGGTSLQSQEIRNCVFNGPFNDFLHNLNSNSTWRILYNSTTPSKRMKDEELILRFFAIYHHLDEYKKPMNEFLSNYMIKNKNISKENLISMENLFIQTIEIINNKIGISAFRPKRNLNMAAFDSIMYVFAKFQSSLKPNLKESFEKLFQDTAYLKAIREGTTDVDTIHSRIKIAKRYLTNEK